jgi:hypothetical protein
MRLFDFKSRLSTQPRSDRIWILPTADNAANEGHVISNVIAHSFA